MGLGFGGKSRRALHITIITVVALLCVASRADVYIMSLRDNENEVREAVEAIGGNWVESKTKEFDNGNTFVQIKQTLTGHEVEIWLPDSLTSNALMEALIKTRIAHSEGASEVTIVAPWGIRGLHWEGQSNSPELLPLSSLFTVAGATRFTDRRRARFRVAEPLPPRSLTDWNHRHTFVSGTTHPELRDLFARALGAPVTDLQGISRAKMPGLVYHVSPAVSPVNEQLFHTLSEISFMERRGQTVLLVAPYLPYARSDKKDVQGVAVTGRLVADLIEWAGARAIAFVRAHAPQSEGFFFIPTFHISGRTTVANALRELNVQEIISPDAGFQKDATLYADLLNVPVHVLNKQRDPRTGESKLHTDVVLPVQGKVVAVPDDETSSGKTLADAAALLKSQGAAKVIGVVTHLTGNAKKALESPDLDLLVVTNTNPIRVEPHPKLRVLSIEPELTEQLSQINRQLGIAHGCGPSVVSEGEGI